MMVFGGRTRAAAGRARRRGGAAAELAVRAPVGGGDGDGENAHHDVVALPARKLEELLRCVEAEERKAAARVEEAEAMRRTGWPPWRGWTPHAPRSGEIGRREE